MGTDKDIGERPDPAPTLGSAPETAGAGYPVGSEEGSSDSARYRAGSDTRDRASEGEQIDSEGNRAASEGEQSGSDGSRSHTNTPDGAPDFAASMARAETLRRRTEERRAPGLWMPGAEDLDGTPGGTEETGFGVDGPTEPPTSRQLGLRCALSTGSACSTPPPSTG